MRRFLDALDIFVRGRTGYPCVDVLFGLVVAIAISPLVFWLIGWLVG